MPQDSSESATPLDGQTVRCAYCGKKIAEAKALRDVWYGEEQYLCSRDCLLAREHELTAEHDDESAGE